VRDNEYFDEIKTGGRPKMVINKRGLKLVTDLSKIMCSNEEIATSLGVCVNMLTNVNNAKLFNQAKAAGQTDAKKSLRRKQFALAAKNANMAIFLGKNYLDQRDKQEIESTISGGVSLGFDDDLMG
jgi:hypothetical protein